MQKVASTTFMTSEQHEDVIKARKARDDKQSYAVLGFLRYRIPFVPDSSLWNIATGVVADIYVNAHQAKEVRKKIPTLMKGMNALETGVHFQ